MIIGLSGKMGSGKTTVAKMIQEMRPEYEIVHFSTALKRCASEIAGLPISNFMERELKDAPLLIMGTYTTPGRFLQWFGTDLMRAQYPDIWIEALLNKYHPNLNWIIDDVRFKNELIEIIELGGRVIRVEGDPANLRETHRRNSEHISETQLDNHDFGPFRVNTDWGYVKTLKQVTEIMAKI